ncbi:MAG: M48 family metallopeptidase [Spirochaetia bacterium]
MKNSRFLVITIPALLVLLAFFAGCATTDKTDSAQAETAERVEKEMEIGEAAFAKLAGKYGVVMEEEPTVYLNKYLKSLALSVERQELIYSIAVLNTEQVNAYSLPGGYMFISLGMLQEIENPGALAGILAHELGHMNKDHILEHVTIQVNYSFFETLARLLSGSRQVITNAMNQINEKIEERLFIEGYARDEEYEADAYAARMLQALGIGIQSYIGYLKDLQDSPETASLENLDKTHPPLSERIRRLEELAVSELPELKATERFRKFKETIDSIKVE